MTATRVPADERAAYRVITEAPDPEHYTIRVERPDGRGVQWYVRPAPGPWKLERGRRIKRAEDTSTGCYVVAATPEGPGHITRHRSFDEAAVAANRRARTWLGSCWGLKGPARRLP